MSSIEKSTKVLFFDQRLKRYTFVFQNALPNGLWGGALFPSEPGRRWHSLRAGAAVLLYLQITAPSADSTCIPLPCVALLHQKFWPEGPGSRSLHGAPYQQVKLAQAQRKRGNKRVRVYYPDSILISWEFSWALLMTI